MSWIQRYQNEQLLVGVGYVILIEGYIFSPPSWEGEAGPRHLSHLCRQGVRSHHLVNPFLPKDS